jgi:hypothetical protein
MCRQGTAVRESARKAAAAAAVLQDMVNCFFALSGDFRENG